MVSVDKNRACQPAPAVLPSTHEVSPSDMSLVLILVGATLVCVALFNRIPLLRPRPQQPRRSGAAAPGAGLLDYTAPARLTEAGRATVTTIGSSMLLIALVLALSGL